MVTRSSTSSILLLSVLVLDHHRPGDPELAVRLQRAQHQLAGPCAAFVEALDRITAPLYRPIRRIMPDFGGIDFSPLVVLILIQILRMLLARRRERSLVYSAYDRTADRRKSRCRRDPRARRRRRSPSSSAAPAARPASPPCWSARIRRARSMSARRARRPPKPGWRASRTICPTRPPRPSCSPWSTSSTPTTASTASSCSCRCPGRSTPRA